KHCAPMIEMAGSSPAMTRWKPVASPRRCAIMISKPLTFMFQDDGAVPNNPALPALIYKGALDLADARDPAAAIEKLFKSNGWGHGQWRDGIFPFVHYHSMIHEALG